MNYKLLIIIIILINIFNSINSQAIPNTEYNCIDNLFNKVNNAANVKFIFNTTINQYEYCADRAPNIIICNNNKQITSIELQQTKTYAILSSDLNCFKYLKSFKSRQFIFDKNFFYGPFPNSLESINLLNTKKYGESFEIDLDYKDKLNNSNSLTNKIKNLEIVGGVTTSGTDPKYIYLSSLATFNEIKFTMGNNPISNEYQFYFINDLNQNFKSSITYFETYCSNIPSLNYNNKIIKEVVLTYLPGFSYTSVSNFSTYSEVEMLELYAKDETQLFPFPLGLEDMPPNNRLTYLSVKHQIDTPPHLINLSNLDGEEDIIYYEYEFDFPNVGPKFNVDGKFPFSKLPDNLVLFTLSGGTFTEFPNLYSIFNGEFGKSKIMKIHLQNNLINAEIPKTLNIEGLNLLNEIDLRGNNLTGTIDESWCYLSVQLEGNQIGGEAPSCIICHYRSTLGIYWKNINFTNTNITPLPKCTTIVLNMIYDEITDLFLIYGYDIGAKSIITITDSYKWLSNCTHIPGFQSITNKQFCLQYSKSVLEPNPFSLVLTYRNLPKDSKNVFELAAYNKFIPIIDSVIKYSNYFIITGKYFAYNSSVINITISDEYTCNVISCDFNQIQCYLYASDKIISRNNNQLKLTVKIMDVYSDFNFIPNEICNGTNCPTLDGNCTNDSLYNLKTGACECTDSWFGYTCEVLKIKCIESCTYGECNYSNGECIKPKECINDPICSNKGECDYDIGKCNCTDYTKWIGDYCSIPNHYSNYQSILNYTNPSKIPLTIINGWFGNINSNLSIYINQKPCNIIQISDLEIQCYQTLILPTNNNTSSSNSSSNSNEYLLTITQNNINWNGIFNPKIINIDDNTSSSESSESSESSGNNSSSNDSSEGSSKGSNNSESSSSSSESSNNSESSDSSNNDSSEGSSSSISSNNNNNDDDHNRKVKIALATVFPILTVLSISFIIYKFKFSKKFKNNNSYKVKLRNID